MPCRQLAWRRRSIPCISLGLCNLPPQVAVPYRARAGADEVPWRKRSGKGKGKGKEKGLDVKKATCKHQRTHDGQLLCFGYNKQFGCTRKNCHFAHVCLGNHQLQTGGAGRRQRVTICGRSDPSVACGRGEFSADGSHSTGR